jgi:iron complex transport system permease protein
MLKLRAYVQSNNELLIFGILFSAFASAVVSVLQAMAQREDLQRLVIWTQGNFDGNNLSYLLPWFLVILGCSIVAIRHIHQIEILSISDSYALTLGINPLTEGYRLLTLSGLLVGITTAICGPISFIGIVMPQLIRYVFYKSPLRMQFLWCLVASAIFALFCDFISNTWRPLGFFMPINAATALLGAPIIAYLLRLRSV